MGTFDAFQRLVWSPQFKQNCFPHRSKMGVLKSFLRVNTVRMVVIAIFRFIDENLSIIDCYAEAVHVFRNFVHVF